MHPWIHHHPPARSMDPPSSTRWIHGSTTTHLLDPWIHTHPPAGSMDPQSSTRWIHFPCGLLCLTSVMVPSESVVPQTSKVAHAWQSPDSHAQGVARAAAPQAVARKHICARSQVHNINTALRAMGGLAPPRIEADKQSHRQAPPAPAIQSTLSTPAAGPTGRPDGPSDPERPCGS